MRKSKSIAHLGEVETKVGKIKKDLQTLPSDLQNNLKSGDYAASGIATVNKMEGSYPTDKPLNVGVIVVLLFPFIAIFIYSLISFFSSLFLLGYFCVIFLYYALLLAFFVSEVAIRPYWYNPSKPGEALTLVEVPPYWQGIIHNPKEDLKLEYEDIEFKNKNNLTLRGWFVPGLSTARNKVTKNVAVVFVHGGARDRRAFLRHVPIFHKQGMDCLLFDFQEHGVSDGSRRGFSYGIREKEDVKKAVQWMIHEKKKKEVLLVGTSVGGSACLMAAAESPQNIVAVIAENPVACADEFGLFHLKKMIGAYAPRLATHWILKPFYKSVSIIFLFRIGGLFGYNKPVDVIHKISPIPVLLLHGTADDLVPIDHSERLFSAAKEPKYFWIAKEACHCALYDKYPQEYENTILKFFDNVFKEEGNKKDDNIDKQD